MTRTTDPTFEADDVVRRLRGALDDLTADISEATVADHPSGRVHELRRRPSRRTWLVPAAAAVVAVVAGVVVVGDRDDGGPSGISPLPSDWTTQVPVATSGPSLSDPTPPVPVATDAPSTESTGEVPAAMDGIGFVVGASVTLGAAEALVERGFVVDAEIARQASAFAETIQQAVDAGLLPDAVVVHPGANGPISEDDMAALMAAVADVSRVIVVTDRPHRPWSEPNNALIRSLPDEHPNVVVLDWAVLSDACTGDCFALDEVHLGTDGRTFYADLVLDAAAAP